MKNHDNGRLYSGYIQLGTRTGRYTSEKPNAQQIDRRLRSLFGVSNGNGLVECDFSNIELRLAAEISKDPTLVRLYQNNADVHRGTASKVFHIPEDQVTKDQRQIAKIINFASLYGGGKRALQEQLPGLTDNEALGYLDAFKRAYPGLLTYWDRCKHKSIKIQLGDKKYAIARSILGR